MLYEVVLNTSHTVKLFVSKYKNPVKEIICVNIELRINIYMSPQFFFQTEDLAIPGFNTKYEFESLDGAFLRLTLQHALRQRSLF